MQVGDLVNLIMVFNTYDKWGYNSPARIVEIRRCPILLRPKYLLRLQETGELKWFDPYEPSNEGYALIPART